MSIVMTTEPSGTPQYRAIPALKRWMDARELRQYELAKMLGVTAAQVSRWLSGHRSVPAAIAVKLSDLTGIPAEQLSNRPETSRLLKLLSDRPKSRSKTQRKNAGVA